MSGVWLNLDVTGEASNLFDQALRERRLERSARLEDSTIAFGQPDPGVVLAAPHLRWIHLSSAGYTRYDVDSFRAAMQARGTMVTTSSAVYADPCAQHVFAMMLAGARQLPESVVSQKSDHAWNQRARRIASSLLTGQRVVLLGFGAIGQRLAALLAPFAMEITALRRSAGHAAGVRLIQLSALDAALANADHVVDLLPENPSTIGFCGAARFAAMKRGARFYNIGRGPTVDQPALIAALTSGALGAAFLDVTTPEPLPADHPLWTAPNCWITPHSAGGHTNETERLVAHFLENLTRFTAGQSLQDRVI
jgi:phosphoglycerate dehydrogenase-like enzyme